ncbi:MAG: hypothetical protein JO263_07610, partial [Candidatus Eremiobacteraeota bacterium]|nr:hypothetical protein [Candidatus Eremiobacteraeota bacterium]
MTFLFIPYAAAFVLVFAEWRGRLNRFRTQLAALPAWAWIGALAVTYASQLLVVRAAALQTPRDLMIAAHGAALPIPVLLPGFPHADWYSAAFLLGGLVQTVALAELYRTGVSRTVLFAGAAVLTVMSVCAPGLTSFDLYGYVHDSLLGLAAYLPPYPPFRGEYHSFDLWFGGPTPTLYGPLWFPIVESVMSLGSTLLGKLVVYRLFSAALVAVVLFLLRALGQSRRMLAIVALNPALLFLTVANGHNDVLAIAIVLLAACFAQRSLLLAAATIALAGLIKLPYAVLGLPVLGPYGTQGRRAVASVVAIAAALTLSWIGGGTGYFADFHRYSGRASADEFARVVAVVAALCALGIATLANRRL